MESPFKNLFALLQKIGKSLMVPVSVLPVAGLLLGIGSANFSFFPAIISQLMAKAGGAIFGNLPLIFAIGVSLGLTNNDGVGALAGTIGYAVMTATMGVMAVSLGVKTESIMGMDSINTGVFGGIMIGAVAAWIFNRYYRVQLPSYLGFFSGKRLVPILTSIAAIFLGVTLSLIWPPIGRGIAAVSKWASSEQPGVAFAMYGLVERSLLPFGLHHIWNVPFFFEVGEYLNPATNEMIRGEIHRFTAGDPTAGNLAGGYLFKMWGLPAAALAMWATARPEQRDRVGGLMVSAALTSFLTGITEPIEFSFLFVAPMLYGIHACLAAAAFFLCVTLGIKHGTTFSHGLIDYLVLFPKTTHALWLLVIGPLWAGLYFFLFKSLIEFWNLPTPGREPDADQVLGPSVAAHEFSRQLTLALGGKKNIRTLDACITRLRVELHDIDKVNASRLKELGATGVVVVGTGIQAIFGTQSENLKTDLDEYLQHAGPEAEPSSLPSSGSSSAPIPGYPVVAADTAAPKKAETWVKALGGKGNLVSVAACAQTRLKVVLKEGAPLNEPALRDAGVQALMSLPGNTFHLIVGFNADQYAREMKRILTAQ